MPSEYDSNEYYFDDLCMGNTQLIFCGHQKCRPGHTYGPFVRTHYLMVYVHSGKGAFKTLGTEYHLQKGGTFFIFPGVVTRYQADIEEPWEYSWVAFNGGMGGYDMSQFLLRASITAQNPVFMVEDPSSFDRLYQEIYQFGKNQEKFVDIKVMSLFLDIMYQYIVSDNSLDNRKKISSSLSDHLDLAVEYIKFYYNKNISVSDIARYLGISREYFCNLFKKYFAISPAKFLNQYRLKNASTLLMMTNQSIADIAGEVGFSDYNYFSSRFHKLYGVSPSEYRKRYRRGQDIPDPFRDISQ